MNLKIDVATIRSLDFPISDAEEEKLAELLQKVFEERIATEMLSAVGKDAALQLANLAQKSDDEAVAKWIATNVPEYENIVKDEYNILMSDLVKNPSQFMAFDDSQNGGAAH